MVANVNTMFAVKTPPWHGLGKILENAPTSSRAIIEAGLDWGVSRVPLKYDGPDGTLLTVHHRMGIMREDTGEVLGICNPKFAPVQNEEAFSFMDDIVGRGNLVVYETAGCLGRGETIWLLARINDGTFEPLSGDPVEPYILLANGHDGSRSLSARFTSVRVVCQNTLNLATAGSASSISIRHSGDMLKKLEDARTQLGFGKLEKAKEHLRQLARLEVVQSDIDDFLLELVPKPTGDEDPSRRTAMREAIRVHMEEGPGADLPGIRGTGWWMLNGVTSYVTHEKTSRGHGGDADIEKRKRLESSWFGAGANLVTKATNLLDARLAVAS